MLRDLPGFLQSDDVRVARRCGLYLPDVTGFDSISHFFSLR